MANNLLVKVWECTEHNMQIIHISAHLENMKHAGVSVVNWKLSYCDFKCKFPSAMQSAPHCCAKFEDTSIIFEQNVQGKLMFPESQCAVSIIYCVTLDLMLCFLFFLKATLCL